VTGFIQSQPLWLLARVNVLQHWRRMKSLRAQSRLLSSSIGLFIVAYLSLAFILFRFGLRFLNNFPALGPLLTERLLFLLFAFLFVLLIFSNIVIGYSNYFRNRETQFLVALPISPKTIFRWKFFESAFLASWAFIFLIAPLLAAFGLTRDAHWHFYLMTLAAIAMFIILPGVAGAWVALNLARYLDRRTFQVAGIIALCVFIPVVAIWFRPEPLTEETTDVRVLVTLDKIMMHTHFAEWPWLPSYWLSVSVLNWSEGAITSAMFFLLVLLSNVLFFGYLSFTTLGKQFYESFATVQSRASIFQHWDWFRRRRERKIEFGYPRGKTERFLEFCYNPRSDVMAILVKDARMFWRDTLQWGQTLVLFGLLGVYIINLRHFSQEMTNPFWVHLVCYLNLGACALNLATLTTRFVFPQFSLEGKRLWIIGMAPLGLIQVQRAKYWLASRASLAITLVLIFVSCRMLQMPLNRTLYLAVILSSMTFTLTALATGLGALYPNFREDNPSKIVSGFGGTLCLVVSFLYIVASVAVLAMGSPWGWKGETSVHWIVGSWMMFIAMSLAVGWIPWKLGLHRLSRFEM
jgi:ABC-2 type transport system permease protein